ncbi:MAG TPA: hypothetical protein VNJ04_07240 [Gemmatimonadaceae bacterium]|nr:hypothetical protein [Gemmatimonadaceae bacterium]
MRVIAVSLVLLFVGLVVAISSALAQELPPPQGLPQMVDSGMLLNQQTIWITTLVGFATTIAAIIASMWRESRNTKAALLREARNREWDLEDRRQARLQAEAQLAHQTEELKTVTQLEADLTRAEALRVKAALEVESLRIKVALEAEAVRVKAALEAVALTQRRALLSSQQELTNKINENTSISQHAFKEANDVNKKIAHMQELLKTQAPASGSATEKMIEQVDETHTVVTREFPSISANLSSQQALHDIQEIAEETKDAVDKIVDKEKPHGTT